MPHATAPCTLDVQQHRAAESSGLHNCGFGMHRDFSDENGNGCHGSSRNDDSSSNDGSTIYSREPTMNRGRFVDSSSSGSNRNSNNIR
jgi:hypothetical protein